MMFSGFSPRGLSLVTTTRSAFFSATAAISGRLVGVALAAAAEHAPELAAALLRQRLQRLQRLVQRIGRVRVVHRHQRLAGHAQPLHAARAPAAGRRRPRTASASGTPTARIAPITPSRLDTLYWPISRVGEFVALGAFAHREAQALRVVAGSPAARRRAGCWHDTVHRSSPPPRSDCASSRPFSSSTLTTAALQAGPAEQLGLGFPVGLHGAVVVQVVLGEIGEDRDPDARAVQPALDDADRRGLDRAGLQALVHETAELALQQHRVGRGEAGELHLRRPAGAQRADQAAGVGRSRRAAGAGSTAPAPATRRSRSCRWCR